MDLGLDCIVCDGSRTRCGTSTEQTRKDNPKTLLARVVDLAETVIRMALVANFYFDDVGILGCTGLESSATSTYNSRFVLSMKRQSTLICGAPTLCQQKK